MENEIINSAKENGKINININEVIYDELRPGQSPALGPDQPIVENEALGEWNIVTSNWAMRNQLEIPEASDFWSGDGWIRKGTTYKYLAYYDIWRLIISGIDKDSVDHSEFFRFHNSEITKVKLKITVNGGYADVEEWVYFREMDDLPGVFYTLGGTFLLGGPNNQNQVYSLSFTYPGRIEPSEKIFPISSNFNAYGVTGEEANAALVSDIMIQNKDSILRFYYSFDVLSPLFDAPNDTLQYFYVTLVFGNAGSNDNIQIHSPIINKPTNTVVGNFLVPINITNYDWYQITITGSNVAVDGSFDVPFEAYFVEDNIR